MRCVFTSIMVMVLLLAGMPMHVHAIATANLTTSERSPANTVIGATFNWDYIYNYKGASATAVDHYWILTAAHVADDGVSGNLVIDGETYTQQEVVFHTQAADPGGNETADIALVRYDKKLPGYYLLADSVPVESDILTCGFGFPGNVVSLNNAAYFTEDDTAGHITKRWGTNRIDFEDIFYSTVPIVATSRVFNISISTKNSQSKTAYEAGCNIYDSGGGMFFNDEGEWKLVGHMVARYSSGGQLRGNLAAATKYYVNWIKSVIVDYDTDMDGLPDWWEMLHGETEAGEDPDVDGFTNYEEWLADTLPNDSNSFLRVTAYTNATSLVFSSSDNRKYQVQYRVDMADSNTTWQTESGSDWFDGSYPQTVQTVSDLTGNRFYRVRVKLR